MQRQLFLSGGNEGVVRLRVGVGAGVGWGFLFFFCAARFFGFVWAEFLCLPGPRVLQG